MIFQWEKFVLCKYSYQKYFCCVILAFWALAASADGAEKEAALYSRYKKFTATFWSAENSLRKREGSIYDIYQFSLSPDDPLYQKYFEVNNAAGRYLQELQNARNATSWTIPHTLYLGGIAAFTIGDYANAERYFSLLLRDFSQYHRDHYISENFLPDLDFSDPVKPGVSKLLFYCQIRGSGVSPEKVSSPTGETPEPRIAEPRDSFIAFQQFNQTALKVLLSQQEFAKWLINRPYRSQRRIFLNEDYGKEQPDQRRATVLPNTSQLINEGWEELFPAALKKSGASKMRAYLRELTKPDSLFKEMAMSRLMEVDQLVIKHYFAQAKVLLRKHNFAGARKKYRQIIAEYPDSTASNQAEVELPKVAPIAIKFYKIEGEKNFNPGKQFGVPQTKARESFEKMYSESVKNDITKSADYALYHWARALGTEGNVKKEVELLQSHLEKFPRSKQRAKVLYLLAFTYGNNPLAQHDKAIAIYQDIVKKYPKAEEASESLWQIAYLEGVNSRYDKAIVACQKLVANYPRSYRYKVAKEWEGRFGELMRSGKKWPG